MFPYVDFAGSADAADVFIVCDEFVILGTDIVRTIPCRRRLRYMARRMRSAGGTLGRKWLPENKIWRSGECLLGTR